MPRTASEYFPAVRLISGVGWVCVRTRSVGMEPDGRDVASEKAAPADALRFNVVSLPEEVAVVAGGLDRGAEKSTLRFLSARYADAVWMAAAAEGAAVIGVRPETKTSMAAVAAAAVNALAGGDESTPIAVSSRAGIDLIRLERDDAATWRAEVRSITCPWQKLLATFRDIGARGGEPTVVAFDWDRALVFNDGYGHLQGDLVLARVAQTMAKHAVAEGIDFVRVAGDEFLAVFPPALAARAEPWAVEVTAAIRALAMPLQHPELGDLGFVSFTACVCSLATTPIDGLIDRCGSLWQVGKRDGGGRVIVDSALPRPWSLQIE